MQWSADVTEHAHVEEIKVPARSGNNQNYYSQIAQHLDQLDKCFRFDLATYIEQYAMDQANNGDGDSDSDSDEQHKPDAETIHLSEYSTPTRQFPDYFSISASLILGAKPSAPKPYRTFAMSTTGFHLATKPLLRLSVDEAALHINYPISRILSLLLQMEMCISRVNMALKISRSGTKYICNNYHTMTRFHYRLRPCLPSHHRPQILMPSMIRSS